MVSFTTWVSLGATCVLCLALVNLIPRRRGWISAAMSASTLLALAVSSVAYELSGWWTEESNWWPFAVTSAALGLLVILMKSRVPTGAISLGKFFPGAFFGWVVITAALALLLVTTRIFWNNETTATLGLVTLGLCQLGFAGVFVDGLVESQIGKLAWQSAIVLGCIMFLIGWFIAAELMSFLLT